MLTKALVYGSEKNFIKKLSLARIIFILRWTYMMVADFAVEVTFHFFITLKSIFSSLCITKIFRYVAFNHTLYFLWNWYGIAEFTTKHRSLSIWFNSLGIDHNQMTVLHWFLMHQTFPQNDIVHPYPLLSEYFIFHWIKHCINQSKTLSTPVHIIPNIYFSK